MLNFMKIRKENTKEGKKKQMTLNLEIFISFALSAQYTNFKSLYIVPCL